MMATAAVRRAANDLATSRILDVRPQWFALRRASEQLELADHELLCAGPPLSDPTQPCVPVLHAAVSAALLEGWASTPEQARAMVHAGKIVLRAAQDQDCVVPLADVLSPSMWVQVVRDGAGQGRMSCSPFNGGMAHPMRVGVFDPGVVAHLRWLDTHLAPALQGALLDPVDLINLADEGLAGGDDCHGKTPVATRALARILGSRLGGKQASVLLAYLDQSPGYFLNLWMAASRCMLSAAADTTGSSVVTVGAGNGLEFGIQLAGTGGRWFVHRADAPRMPDCTPELLTSSLGAIGDSAIVDLLGLGAMTSVDSAAPEPAGFVSAWPDLSAMPRALLKTRHDGFRETRPALVIDADTVAASSLEPVISLGVLDRNGQRGRIGGGFYRVPAELFAAALSNLNA